MPILASKRHHMKSYNQKLKLNMKIIQYLQPYSVISAEFQKTC